MIKKTLIFTALLGALGIILGALGAHTFKDVMTAKEFEIYHTAVFYQMIHVIAILAVNAFHQIPKVMKTMVSHTFLTGIILFSGSLYMISLQIIDASSIWWVTPLGGIFLILGWLMLTLAFIKTPVE